jgi:hypothetical protein
VLSIQNTNISDSPDSSLRCDKSRIRRDSNKWWRRIGIYQILLYQKHRSMTYWQITLFYFEGNARYFINISFWGYERYPLRYRSLPSKRYYHDIWGKAEREIRIVKLPGERTWYLRESRTWNWNCEITRGKNVISEGKQNVKWEQWNDQEIMILISEGKKNVKLELWNDQGKERDIWGKAEREIRTVKWFPLRVRLEWDARQTVQKETNV